MMRGLARLILLLAVTGSIGIPGQAHASLDLATFLEWASICGEQPRDQQGQEKCWFAKAYLLGSVEGVFAMEKRGYPNRNPAICRYPSDVTGTELFEEFVRFAENSKAVGGLSPTAPTARFVVEFLASQRPCRETEQ